MTNRALLFIDDDPADLPTSASMKHLLNRYGLDALLADAKDPINSGLQLLDENPNVVAVLTDKCGQTDFSHVTRFRRLRPWLLIGLLSSYLGIADKNRALLAGADLCFLKSDRLQSFYELAANELRMAERRFRVELPALLKDSGKLGQWVACTFQGVVDVQDDDEDGDLTLIRRCERSIGVGKFVVSRVVPDVETLEVSEAWNPLAD